MPLSREEQNLLDYHKQNLYGGTYLHDGEGWTTLYLQGVNGPDGRIYNVPGYWDGARHGPQESLLRAIKQGISRYPSYQSEFSGPIEMHPANVAARGLHQYIDNDMMEFFNKIQAGISNTRYPWSK